MSLVLQVNIRIKPENVDSFMQKAPEMYAIFVVFILANLLMIPLGYAAIKGAKQLLRAPRELLMPVILLFFGRVKLAINANPAGSWSL